MKRTHIPSFTQIGQEMYEVQTEIHSFIHSFQYQILQISKEWLSHRYQVTKDSVSAQEVLFITL